MMYGNLTLSSLKRKLSSDITNQISSDFTEVTNQISSDFTEITQTANDALTLANTASVLANSAISTTSQITTRLDGQLNKPTFSLTFDDGWESQFTRIRPILGERGIRGTFFIMGNPDLMQGAPYLTESQIKQLADEGHEVADHTRTHPRTPTGAQMREEWLYSKPWLESVTGKQIFTHCYPYGDFNDDVNRMAEGVFEATRGLDNGGDGMYNSRAYPVDGYLNIYIKRLIDRTIEAGNGSYCTLVMHEIYEDGDASKPSNRQTVSQFTEWVDYLVSLRDQGLINIVPYYQGMRMVQKGLASIY